MAVRLAQRLLNSRLRRTPGYRRLREDGAYGPRTAAVVTQFQHEHHVAHESGFIGPTTWRALGLSVEIDHPVRMRAQHYDMGCWSACASMVLDRDMSVGTGGAALGTRRGLMDDLENVEAFARSLGWEVESPPGNVAGLVRILAGTPIWISGNLLLDDGTLGGHVVVISGAWGDGSPYGTFIRVHDPWPVDHGTVTTCTYPAMVVSEGSAFDPTMIAGPL